MMKFLEVMVIMVASGGASIFLKELNFHNGDSLDNSKSFKYGEDDDEREDGKEGEHVEE